MAGLLEGIAQGGMMGMIGKKRKEGRDAAAARKDQRATLANLDSADAKNKADLEAGDYGQPSAGERQAEHDVQLADGGRVQGYKSGGMIKGYRRPKQKMPRVGEGGEVGYADGGLIAGANKPNVLKGINAKPAPKSDRDAGKRQPSAPMIGVRADADPANPDVRTEVQLAANNPDNTVALADGGAVPGYAAGGLLFGNFLPGGYTQHGSMTQTTDPLWHMECHRDFGKKQP